jgi:hypothetical protein
MSDRASIILGHLGDADVLTIDELVEATGFERSAVHQELVGLKAAGQCHSGRGGWRLSPDVIAPAKVRRHEAQEPAADPGKREQAKARMAKVRAKRKAAVSPPVRTARPGEVATDRPTKAAGRFIYGISENGELTVTDGRDEAKTVRLSASDTARLALLFKRWATLIDVKEAA